MSKKKTFLLIFIIFFYSFEVIAKQLNNNVVVSIDNLIITELDIKKEIIFLKVINKDQLSNNTEQFKKEIIKGLIDRKIKEIETFFYKIEISDKEVEQNLYSYLEGIKITNETLSSYFNKNEIESDYLKNIIRIDLKWSKLIRQIYGNRINVNLTEVNKQFENEKENVENVEKFKNQLIITEQNKLLNKFAATHLEKSKKKYLINFL
jgi:hypothetical protein